MKQRTLIIITIFSLTLAIFFFWWVLDLKNGVTHCRSNLVETKKELGNIDTKLYSTTIAKEKHEKIIIFQEKLFCYG